MYDTQLKSNIRKIYVRIIQEGLSTTIPSISIEDVKEKLHKLRTQNQKGQVLGSEYVCKICIK